MKINLITVEDLSPDDINQIFELSENAKALDLSEKGNLAACYSFEGDSLRTRSTFVKALFDLGVTPIELPNLLKSKEDVEHLAGYLDHWFDIYIIRDRNHQRLTQFSEKTKKPVINALSSEAHPCEVMADVYSVLKNKGELKKQKFCILGPPTNVLKSWERIGHILDLDIIHVMPTEFISEETEISKITHKKLEGLKDADVILTDAWPQDFDDRSFQLSLQDLEFAKPNAWVIPCPPFNIQNEVHQDVLQSTFFAGYGQKRYLYDVQKALIYFLLNY